MYKILEELPNGCLRIANEDGGIHFIETGDFRRALELLSAEDYTKLQILWTPELIAARKSELERQAQMQADMLV